MDFDNLFSILEKETKKFNVPVVDLIKTQTKNNYKILVSTILSARTKDEITAEASSGLFKKAENFLELNKLGLQEIEKLIYPVGFYKTKAKHLKQVGQIILEKYKGKIPSEIESLLSLPGVGRKTANLYLSVALNKDAICVDTHVHRIFNRLGLIKTKKPSETEKELMKLVPKKYWKKINFYFVAWGQNTCKPINPKCNFCKISKFCKRVGVNVNKQN